VEVALQDSSVPWNQGALPPPISLYVSRLSTFLLYNWTYILIVITGTPITEQYAKLKEKNQTRLGHVRTSSSMSTDSRITEVRDSVESTSTSDTKESTPSSSALHHPVPIPALKIVKRSQTLTRPIVTTSSRRTSSISATHAMNSRLNAPSSPVTITTTADKQSDVSRTWSKRTNPTQSYTTGPVLGGDGPRRVLISEGPKFTSNASSRTSAQLEQAKPSYAISGPRRVVVPPERGPNMVAKPPAQSSSGLKQPVKYATIGPTTAIPKPIARAAGSKLPAPARFGGAKEIPGRRVI